MQCIAGNTVTQFALCTTKIFIVFADFNKACLLIIKKYVSVNNCHLLITITITKFKLITCPPN